VGGGEHLSDAESRHPPTESGAIDAVPIAEEIAWRRVPGERLDDELGRPLRSRVRLTLSCSTRRRVSDTMISTKTTRNIAVLTVKKSIDTRSCRWLVTNVRQVWEGGF
jgi:hypothetical protein